MVHSGILRAEFSALSSFSEWIILLSSFLLQISISYGNFYKNSADGWQQSSEYD